MYKLLLHPTERKNVECFKQYFEDHPRIRMEFAWEEDEISEDDEPTPAELSNPDLLVQQHDYTLSLGEHYSDHCGFEHKFGMDLVSSLNSGLLQDELTRMKAKYTDPMCEPEGPCEIPLYLVIINEWDDEENAQVISPIYLARAVTIAQDLNIRVIYCNTPQTFAKNVFRCIRKPPKPVDLGQRFVKKSSGSEFNRELQCEPGITKETADKIEKYYLYWPQLIDDVRLNPESTHWKEIFTTDTHRFMKANMAKFLRKVSGQ